MENFVTAMTQEEYKTGMLRQTHNKDEDLRNCTYVAIFINFVATMTQEENKAGMLR